MSETDRNNCWTRRRLVGALGLGAASGALPAAAAPKNALPRWRGFNLLYLFQARRQTGPVEIPEDDFRMIADLGFDFVRIPMDYWFWIEPNWRQSGRPSRDDVLKIVESGLEPVDRIVEFGRKYGIHVSLNFHRGPGYCINDAELEPFVLWRDAEAEEAFVHH